MITVTPTDTGSALYSQIQNLISGLKIGLYDFDTTCKLAISEHFATQNKLRFTTEETIAIFDFNNFTLTIESGVIIE